MFEWDERKRESNLFKHNVDFDDAIGIWDGEVVETEDPREYTGEIRFAALGQLRGEVLHVAFTWRDCVRRIISARRANRRERRTYYETLSRRSQRGKNGLGKAGRDDR